MPIQRSLFTRAALLASMACPSLVAGAQGSSPNIIHIFADDLSWGSVGFNNPGTYIQTPNMDALAAGGMILNRSYSMAICSPSRDTLMTGMHSGHSFNDRNSNIGSGLRAEDVTTGEIMQSAGYSTALMGKWGWGASGGRTVGTGADPQPTLNTGDQAGDLPNNQGFDRFYGFLNHSAAHDHYYDWVWETDANGGMILNQNNNGAGGGPELVQDLVNQQSEQYIRDMAGQNEPFYLQLNYITPHFDIDAVATAPEQRDLDGEDIGPAGQGLYAGDGSLTTKQKNYAQTVTRMDTSIGAIIDRLKDPDGDGLEDDSILDNTLIIFSSDNGAATADGFGSGNVASQEISAGLRGGKRDLYEGGIHMPAFAYWNGTIEAGTETDLLNDLADVQATAADLAGVLPRVGIDGVSILPTLTGQGDQRVRNGLLFELFEDSTTGNPNTRWAVIAGDMKLVRRADGVNELYDLSTDPGESSPLDLVANAGLVAELEALALAEGAGQPDSHATSYRDWAGGDGDQITDAASWQVTSAGGQGGTPDGTWSALLAGAAGGDETAFSVGNIETLGIEVAGLNGNTQALVVQQGGSLTGRNEVRVNTGGRVVLENAALHTARWIDVLAGGELEGQGSMTGDIYNAGVLDPSGVVPPDSFTDTPATLIVFDFAGVQDNNGGSSAVGTPLEQTSTLDGSLRIIEGFQAGAGVGIRHPAPGSDGSDQGDEWNVNNLSAASLDAAIAGDDYLGFVVAPVAGLEMLLDEASFSFWRNGVNAATDYAILTSIDGFTGADALAATQITHAQEGGPDRDNPETLTADYTGGDWVTGLDVRLYGWGGATSNGNTHITAASLAGHFRVAAGSSVAGSFSLEGNLYQLAGGEIQIGLGGADNPGPLNPSFDQINVTGDVELAGSLALDLVDGFIPTLGDSFTILTSGGLTGEFDRIDGARVEGTELVLNVSYTPTDVVLTAMQLGDLNGDGGLTNVDIASFVLALTGPDLYANTYPGLDPDLLGDFNQDGLLTEGDISGFVDALTRGGVAADASAIPEPSSLVLLGLGGLHALRRRRV